MGKRNIHNTAENTRPKKTYARVSNFEKCRIKQYCLKYHLSENRFMIESAIYCIENNIPVKELFSDG